MIKAIIFDIGGILDKGRPEDHWKSLCDSLHLDLEKFLKARVWDNGRARRGEITTKEYVSEIAKQLGVDYKTLIGAWLKTKRENMEIDKEIEELFVNLKSKGYKLATVSNIIELHNKVRVEKNAYSLFDFAILSFKVGIDKPNPKIYQMAIDKLKMSPDEILFIDDSERNSKAAADLGMKTIRFKDNASLIQDLKKLGVKI
jgi:epoxide hydrolase-like predicted phosphatase